MRYVATILLPLYWLLLVSAFAGSANRDHASGLRLFDSFVMGTAAAGTTLWATTNLLSTLTSLNRTWITLAYLAFLAIAAYLTRRVAPRGFRRLWVATRNSIYHTPTDEAFHSDSAHRRLGVARPGQRARLIDIGWHLAVAGLLLLTLLCALLYSPSVWDSNSHHLPRILQFIQNQTVAWFPTFYAPMNTTYPFAAHVLTVLKALSGGDRLLNLVQWLAYAVVSLGVYHIASARAARLGITGRDAKIASRVASLAALCTPILVLEASSSQYDLITAAWSVLAVYAVLRMMGEAGRSWMWPVTLGALVGLGFVTKITFLITLAPFVIWLAVVLIRHDGLKVMLARAAVALAVAAVIASPWLLANAAHGDIVGATTPGNVHILVPDHSPGALWANATRNLAASLATPFDSVNAVLVDLVRPMGALLGGSVDDPANKEDVSIAYGMPSSPTNPDMAGSPLSIALIVIGTTIALIAAFRRHRYDSIAYVGSVIGGAVAISLMVTWQPFIVRTFVPCLALGAPMIGIASALAARRLRPVIIAVLVLNVAWAMFVGTFNVNQPMAPITLVTRGCIECDGWWDLDRDGRTRFQYPFMNGAMDAVDRFGPGIYAVADDATVEDGAVVTALVGGAAAEGQPIYLLANRLADMGYTLVYQGDYGAQNQPGRAAFADDQLPNVVVSVDPNDIEPGTAVLPQSVGEPAGTTVSEVGRYKLRWVGRVGQLGYSVSLWEIED